MEEAITQTQGVKVLPGAAIVNLTGASGQHVYVLFTLAHCLTCRLPGGFHIECDFEVLLLLETCKGLVCLQPPTDEVSGFGLSVPISPETWSAYKQAQMLFLPRQGNPHLPPALSSKGTSLFLLAFLVGLIVATRGDM